MVVRNGVPQSKGYGFVEFTHHCHALSCLRELSNSSGFLKYLPDAMKQQIEASGTERKNNRLILEFSLENFNKVNS
jgi:nucleolar protein 4